MTLCKKTLLIIDDDPMVRETLASLLRATGHSVQVADTGQAGLACLNQDHGAIDLVLTDLGMPDMTGWEVARSVKAKRPALPVILLTGWGDQVDAGSDARGVVDRILGKPVRMNQLLDTIAEVTKSTAEREA